MSLQRGFKSDANWYARDVRRDLRLAPYAPLCPWKLAAHLDLDVIAISSFAAALPEAVNFLTAGLGAKEFSAVTIYLHGRRVVVHNDSHTPGRQAANLAHEAAHALLLHPARALQRAAGVRHFDQRQEDEASWLGPALLVSDEAAVHIVKAKMSMNLACETYGVSPELLRMRLNVTGAYARVARRAA